MSSETKESKTSRFDKLRTCPEQSRRASIHLISLGCAKNLVDSEVMLGSLLKAGHSLEQDPKQADVIIVNTCGFVEGAKKESIDAILKVGELRAANSRLNGGNGTSQKLLVAGCLSQRYSGELQKELPEVDAFIGLNEVPRIHEILEEMRNAEQGIRNGTPGILEKPDQSPSQTQNSNSALRTPNSTFPTPHSPLRTQHSFVSRRPIYLYDFATPRYQLTPSHFAYLKIAEGCNHPCAFCSIPAMRGRHRSRPLDDIQAEARSLLAAGVRELCLISQDTTYYGRDLGMEGGLGKLLRALDHLEGDFWIRILYTHSAHWDEKLMEAIAECPKVCRYVDMPLQHIHDDLLLRMRRETSRKHIEGIIAGLRKIIPGIAIRTTFIAGFPGETDAHFQSLMEFVETTKFERLGVFEYSMEDGTVAGRMEDQIPSPVKKERRERLMAIQQKVSSRIMSSQVGHTLRVLVEKNGKGARGRSQFDAPDIDGRILLRGGGWKLGNFQDAKIAGAREYDLIGVRNGDCELRNSKD